MAQMRKYKYSSQIHSTYAYYCWAENLLVFLLFLALQFLLTYGSWKSLFLLHQSLVHATVFCVLVCFLNCSLLSMSISLVIHLLILLQTLSMWLAYPVLMQFLPYAGHLWSLCMVCLYISLCVTISPCMFTWFLYHCELFVFICYM